jgi:hypothetical protein
LTGAIKFFAAKEAEEKAKVRGNPDHKHFFTIMKKLTTCWSQIQNLETKNTYEEEIIVAEAYITLANYFGSKSNINLLAHCILYNC